MHVLLPGQKGAWLQESTAVPAANANRVEFTRERKKRKKRTTDLAEPDIDPVCSFHFTPSKISK